MFGRISTIGACCIVISYMTFNQIPISLAGLDDPSPKDRLLSEYPAALKRLEELYARERGKAVFSRTASKTGVKSTSEVRFACDSGQSRSIDGTGGVEMVRCSNSDYSFRLRRGAPDRPYVIDDVAEGTGRLGEFGRYYFDGYLGAPYVAFGLPIREIMDRPEFEFKLLDVSEVAVEGRRLFKMSFECRLSANFPLAPTWIEVDPEYGWAVRRFEMTLNASRNVRRSGSVEYSGMEGGRPVVRRVLFTGAGYDEVMDVTEIEFERKSNPRDFTLSAFGLPEVTQKPGPTGSIPLTYWLFGLGAVALILAIVVRRAGRERPAPSSGRAA